MIIITTAKTLMDLLVIFIYLSLYKYRAMSPFLRQVNHLLAETIFVSASHVTSSGALHDTSLRTELETELCKMSLRRNDS